MRHGASDETGAPGLRDTAGRPKRLTGAIVVVLTLMPAARAAADTTLPVIVTYEMAKRRDAERAIARDPKGFWIHQIVTRLEDTKPNTPPGLKGEHTAEIEFVVGRDGAVVAKRVKRSSGEPAIDALAMAMIGRAQPFPPMPASLADKDLTFTLPLRFR